jgi:hypothetical protein
MTVRNRYWLEALVFLCATLCAADSFSADGALRRTALETLLIERGFVAVAEAPYEFDDFDFPDDGGYKIAGSASQPTLEKTWCGPPGPMQSLGLRAGKFTYHVENKGEWGGRLGVQNGGGGPRTLISENVFALMPDADRLMVFTGLEHGDSVGGVYVIDDYQRRPAVRLLTRLPEAPRVIIVKPRDLLPDIFVVIGQRSITAVDSNRRFEVYMAGHALSMPNSALADGAHVYVGICGGVADVLLPWQRSPPSPAKRTPLIRYWVPRPAAPAAAAQ